MMALDAHDKILNSWTNSFKQLALLMLMIVGFMGVSVIINNVVPGLDFLIPESYPYTFEGGRYPDGAWGSLVRVWWICVCLLFFNVYIMQFILSLKGHNTMPG